ncbi:MAG: hypothetical protein H7A36_07265 [Chlamydiales bacterium]|nr:hypothetical protein [Chlamydiales bacterium]
MTTPSRFSKREFDGVAKIIVSPSKGARASARGMKLSCKFEFNIYDINH